GARGRRLRRDVRAGPCRHAPAATAARVTGPVVSAVVVDRGGYLDYVARLSYDVWLHRFVPRDDPAGGRRRGPHPWPGWRLPHDVSHRGRHLLRRAGDDGRRGGD